MEEEPIAVTRRPTGRGLAARLLVLALLAAWPAAAEIGVWEPLGPRSGVVDGFAAAPADGMRLYAVQAVELVLRSDDGGDTWLRYDDGLPDDGVTDLAIDPRRPWFLYAATAHHGVWRLQRRVVLLRPGPGGRPLRPLR